MSSHPDKKKRTAALLRKRGHSAKQDKSRQPPPTQSFAPPPTPSRATIDLDKGKHTPPCYKYYLFGFFAAGLLALLDSRADALVWGFALCLSGLLAVIKPPRMGLGKWGDLAIAGFLATLLLSFLPLFYWSQPDWRVIATDSIGVELPVVLSVQPWSSLEAYFCVIAGIVWFYAAMQWQINYGGRRRLFFGLSIFLSIWAGWVVLKYFSGVYQANADGVGGLSFFGGGTQRAAFFALGGIATFGYAVEGFRHRLAMPLFGLPATLLCFGALYVGEAQGGLVVYYLGVLSWFVWSFCVGGLSRSLKWGLPLAALSVGIAVWASSRSLAGLLGVAQFDLSAVSEENLKLARDSFDLILESPIGGVGMGAFASVFPQYRDASASSLPIGNPGSDFLWLVAEGGVFSLACLALALWFYARRCEGFGHGGSAAYRRLSVITVLSFLVLCFVNSPAHHAGTLYFGLLFAALVLPKGSQSRTMIPRWIWRVVGILLSCVGLIWMAAGSFGWPLHSDTKYAGLQAKLASLPREESHGEALELVEGWLDLRPLDWRAYSERARRTLLLGGDAGEAAADFERARFVEPLFGQVTFEEGLAWLDQDAGRMMNAWDVTLSRELEDDDATFAEMLEYIEESSNVLNGIVRISEQAPNYRAAMLTHLSGGNLMRELERELDEDPSLSRFDTAQRSAIVENWIEQGDFASARGFVSEHADGLQNAWWLQCLIYKSQADFQSAVELIRSHLNAPAITQDVIDDDSLARVSRQFSVQPSDSLKGFALLATYLEKDDYDQALSVIDAMLNAVEPDRLNATEPDLSLYYWKAESLYQADDYIESWFAFEEYQQARRDREVEPVR